MGNGMSLRNSPVPFGFHTTPPAEQELPSAAE